MTIIEHIRTKRKQLGESQATFGKRFDRSHAAVSDWESGKSEAPYEVIEFCIENSIRCPFCKGKGLLS